MGAIVAVFRLKAIPNQPGDGLDRLCFRFELRRGRAVCGYRILMKILLTLALALWMLPWGADLQASQQEEPLEETQEAEEVEETQEAEEVEETQEAEELKRLTRLKKLTKLKRLRKRSPPDLPTSC